MLTSYVVIAMFASLLLAAVSGLGKLRHNQYIVKTVHGVVGVPMKWFPILAVLEIATALGLLLGIKWPPIGAAAAIGMVLYFAGAIAAHVRVSDYSGSWPAIQRLCLAVAALVTRTLSI